MARFAAYAPYVEGFLDVGDGHRVYWEAAGNPNGKPALILHGGPGSGGGPNTRRLFDPSIYHVVQFDQRNCGRSTPHAGDHAVVDLSTNTTARLVADIERLRAHLDVERWLVWGGSWGSCLAMVYAEAHPQRVSELVLASVVAGERREVEWITRAMGRVFPAQWARLRDGVPAGERDGNLAAAYSRLLHDADPAVRERAARAWCEWEDTHVATFPGHVHDERYDDPRFALCFARLVTHYWGNDCFLEAGQIMRDVDRMAHIPAALVHGALDISGPPDVAWALAQRWPAAELTLIGDAGHYGNTTADDVMMSAIARFATRS